MGVDQLVSGGDVNNPTYDSVSTDQATIGSSPTGFPYVTNQPQTVTVDSGGGADYESLQAAINDTPRAIRHEYVFDIKDGHDESVGGDGHVIIQGFVHVNTSDNAEGETPSGEHGAFRIQGNQTTPSNVKIDTLSAFGCVGVQMPTIWGVQFSGDENPDVDESACIHFGGCTEAFIADSEVASGAATFDIQIYAGNAHVRNTTLNNAGLTQKRGGRYTLQNTGTPDADFVGHYFNLFGNGTNLALNETVGGMNFRFRDDANGVVRGEIDGNSGFSVEEQDLSNLSLGSSDDGKLYYHDGASSINADGGTTSSEGWYMWDNSATEFKSVVQH